MLLQDLPKELLIKLIEQGTLNYFEYINDNDDFVLDVERMDAQNWATIISLKTKTLLPGTYKISFNVIVFFHYSSNVSIRIRADNYIPTKIRHQSCGVVSGFNIITIDTPREIEIEMQALRYNSNSLKLTNRYLSIQRVI